MLSQSIFWKGLHAEFGCSQSEFKGVKSSKNTDGRFAYSLNNKWKSNDYIDIKVDESFLYLGVSFPFEPFIRPIKIPWSSCSLDGHKKYWLKKRILVGINCADSYSRTVALPPELVKSLDLKL